MSDREQRIQNPDDRTSPNTGPTPTEVRLAKQTAAHTLWALTVDRTAPARAAMLAKFEREIDADGVLPEAERAKRTKSAQKTFYASIALRSARARRKAREALAEAEATEAELDAAGGAA